MHNNKKTTPQSSSKLKCNGEYNKNICLHVICRGWVDRLKVPETPNKMMCLLAFESRTVLCLAPPPPLCCFPDIKTELGECQVVVASIYVPRIHGCEMIYPRYKWYFNIVKRYLYV